MFDNKKIKLKFKSYEKIVLFVNYFVIFLR